MPREETKTNKAGRELLQAAAEAVAIAKGEADPKTYRVHTPEEIDTRLMRKRMKMSQTEFAKTYGLDLRTLQDWEQGRRVPTGAARSLLMVISKEPKAVARALKNVA